jgi:uncharacterized protein YoxC
MSEKNMKSVVGVQIGKVNASNGTDNYGLPIFIATDKPAWLLDWNGAMVAIDSLLKQIDSKASVSETELDALKVQIESANNAISCLQESTSSLTTNVAGLTTDVTQVKKDVDAMQETVVQLSESVKTLETKVNENKTKITKMADNILVQDGARMHIPSTDTSYRRISINGLDGDGGGLFLVNMKGDTDEAIGTMLITTNFSPILNNEQHVITVPFAGGTYNVRFTKTRSDVGDYGVTVATKKVSGTTYHDTNAIIITGAISSLV